MDPFPSHTGNDIGAGYKDLKIAFKQKFWIDNFIGDLNIFLDSDSPGIEPYKLFIWSDGESSYLCI